MKQHFTEYLEITVLGTFYSRPQAYIFLLPTLIFVLDRLSLLYLNCSHFHNTDYCSASKFTRTGRVATAKQGMLLTPGATWEMKREKKLLYWVPIYPTLGENNYYEAGT